jgi:hypothetical protein
MAKNLIKKMKFNSRQRKLHSDELHMIYFSHALISEEYFNLGLERPTLQGWSQPEFTSSRKSLQLSNVMRNEH